MITICIGAFLLCHSSENLNAQHKSDTVYYFIDCDVMLSEANKNAEGIYGYSPISSTLFQNQQAAINVFKNKIKTKFPNQPGILTTVVFRWHKTMKETEDSRSAKVSRMKKKGFSIIFIE